MPATSLTNEAAKPDPASVLERVNSLRKQLGGLVTLEQDNPTAISWQCPELDQLMPGNGLQPGMILEVLYDRPGSGATSLAMHCAKQAVDRQLGPLVVVDRGQKFYPPAAVARGIEVRDLIVVGPPIATDANSVDFRPKRKRMSSAEEIWALDQALRCKGVAVVMAWLDKLDAHAYRRLQLAAEFGNTLAIFIRPAHVRAQPTWADVQLLVSPQVVRPHANHSGTNPAGPRLAPSVHKTSASRKPAVQLNQGTRLIRATLLRQRGTSG